MRVAVIADAHIGGPGGGPEPLIAQLRSLPEQGCERLILLGDLFQTWIGFERFETPEIRAVADALRALRRGGLPIDSIEGNRDFFLDAPRYADCFDRVENEVAFTAGGKSYLAVHGDGLNDRDRQYLFWRWLSKNRVSRFLADKIPRRLAQKVVTSTEARLSQTNFKHKARIPEEVICRYGERRLAEGFDTLLLGHFHEPRTWQVEGGEIRLLEAWFTGRRVEWFG